MAVITISRQYGSGGEEIAHKVAETLGYDYVDKELIATVAQESQTEESEVSRFDERGRHPITHFLKKYLIGESHVIRAWPTYYWSDELEERLVREGKTSPSSASSRKLFESAIKTLGEQDNVVIVGRGAEIILAGWISVLPVRIIAPLEYRLQRVMREQGFEENDEEVKAKPGDVGAESAPTVASPSLPLPVLPQATQPKVFERGDALKLIKRTDKQRSRYIKQNYGVNWDKPELYQLILDTSQITEEAAANIICEAARGLEVAEPTTDIAGCPTDW